MVAQARSYGRQTKSSLDLCSSKIITKLVKNNFGQHLSELVNILIREMLGCTLSSHSYLTLVYLDQ